MNEFLELFKNCGTSVEKLETISEEEINSKMEEFRSALKSLKQTVVSKRVREF